MKAIHGVAVKAALRLGACRMRVGTDLAKQAQVFFQDAEQERALGVAAAVLPDRLADALEAAP